MTLKGVFTCVVAAAIVGSCARNHTPSPPPATSASPQSAASTQRVVGPLSPEDARALATMNDRLKEYVELHLKFERSLPRLSDNATAEQLDRHKRELRRLMAQARASAKPGDLFTAEARPVILRLLVQVFKGPDGRQMKASINDENSLGRYALVVNAPYPDDAPVTSVPAEVLQTLPKLSEDLQYRFIGTALILLDAHAHMIADYLENALPK